MAEKVFHRKIIIKGFKEVAVTSNAGAGTSRGAAERIWGHRKGQNCKKNKHQTISHNNNIRQ